MLTHDCCYKVFQAILYKRKLPSWWRGKIIDIEEEDFGSYEEYAGDCLVFPNRNIYRACDSSRWNSPRGWKELKQLDGVEIQYRSREDGKYSYRKYRLTNDVNGIVVCFVFVGSIRPAKKIRKKRVKKSDFFHQPVVKVKSVRQLKPRTSKAIATKKIKVQVVDAIIQNDSEYENDSLDCALDSEEEEYEKVKIRKRKNPILESEMEPEERRPNKRMKLNHLPILIPVECGGFRFVFVS